MWARGRSRGSRWRRTGTSRRRRELTCRGTGERRLTVHVALRARGRAIRLIRRGSCQAGGQIDNEFAVYNEIIGGFLEVTSKHFCVTGQSWSDSGEAGASFTISAGIKVNNVANANVDDTEEALVLLLELLLVKDLNGEDAVLGCSPVDFVTACAHRVLEATHISKTSFQ